MIRRCVVHVAEPAVQMRGWYALASHEVECVVCDVEDR
jgi:hypothetical protein